MKNITLFCLFLSYSSQLLAAPYDGIVSKLKVLAKKEHVSLFSLGKNDQGKDILGVVIGDLNSAKVKHLVVGAHHGNETMSAEVPFYFANQILLEYERFKDVAFYVIPVLNISGYNKGLRFETGPNGKDVDANRDYTDPCVVKVDFKLKSTRAIADLIERERIVGAVTVHGYVGSFTFPWGVNASNYETLDHALMTEIATKSAVFNKYDIGTHSGVIYPTAGAFEDWAYYKLGVWSFLLEIRDTSTSPVKDAKALVEFFKQVPTEHSLNHTAPVNCLKQILDEHIEGRP